MSARTMQILADLAARRALDGLGRLCDEQKQVSTGRLYAYVTQAGDTLAGYAFELRREHDALARRCQNLEAVQQAGLGRSGRIKSAAGALGWTADREDGPLEFLIEQAQRCRELQEDRQRTADERDALRAEVERLRNPSDDMLVAGQEVWELGRIGALEDCEEARTIYLAMVNAC